MDERESLRESRKLSAEAETRPIKNERESAKFSGVQGLSYQDDASQNDRPEHFRAGDAGGDAGESSAAASRGLPSAVWRAGQDRRLELILNWLNLDGTLALDIGCGLGMYMQRLQAAGARTLGLEVEWARTKEAREAGHSVTAAVSEALPFASGCIDAILMHEVLEHVADDRATAIEISRVLRPGGRAMIFVPNRLWPFETHGHFWKGEYRFGNTPFINYLPDPLRNRLAPHVRVYTSHALRSCFSDLPLRIVHHQQIFPGYDKLFARRPKLGAAIRKLSYALEKTPFSSFGLSHVLVLERLPDPETASSD